MYNLLFALFLFGMLISLCSKALTRALRQEVPLNGREAALMVALSIGCLAALQVGAAAVYRAPLLSF